MKGNRGVPNPATPRQLRPVELITDRAKRYRANANPPPGPRRCSFCAAAARDIDHIDGDERNGAPRNLQYLCRTCNTRKGITQARAGLGRRTRQYNPEELPAPPDFAHYCDAVLILRGDDADATPRQIENAARKLQATPPAKRRHFVELIGRAKNPDPAAPTYAQYAYAVAVHQRPRWIKGQGFPPGPHDEGGEIIHSTPKALRAKYARQIAASKRQRKR